ncbi:acyl carrier protein [Microvirgula aerodenitrificans]|uniref:acyl carrier protein n=1 Tax=Microvirgula aerodenitrificans TaxID=57480 RepID=UPI00048BDC17|nr:acyl carrier protein [Microvirgula aerodenitrificans]
MKNRIIEILINIRPESDFTQSTDFISDGLLDSFDMIMLVSALDKTFGISIDGADIVPENFSQTEAIEALLIRSGAI